MSNLRNWVRSPNLVPEMSAKSILSTFSDARLYDSIIVSRSPKMDDIFKPSDIINNSSLGGVGRYIKERKTRRRVK